jgi:chromosomal replication initiation ATPase DnaA
MITCNQIISIVAKEFHVTVGEVTNPKNHMHHITNARYVSMYLIRLKNPELSEAEIGTYFSAKYRVCRVAFKSVEDLLQVDKIFKLRFELCLLMIAKQRPPKRAYTKRGKYEKTGKYKKILQQIQY